MVEFRRPGHTCNFAYVVCIVVLLQRIAVRFIVQLQKVTFFDSYCNYIHTYIHMYIRIYVIIYILYIHLYLSLSTVVLNSRDW